jgi:hypothetical protein
MPAVGKAAPACHTASRAVPELACGPWAIEPGDERVWHFAFWENPKLFSDVVADFLA